MKNIAQTYGSEISTGQTKKIIGRGPSDHHSDISKYAELSELTGKYDVFGKNLLSTSVRKQFSLCRSVNQCF
jgi:hypothetical protein